MLTAGHRIGPYVVVSPLGEGGMGQVYLADDTRLRRRVALKVLPTGAPDAARASERLIREARAAARLDHTNICTIFDAGEADGQAYIAMQYIEGESLAERMQRKPIDVREAVALATQAAQALAEAHRQGVVHRDIKPQNVMVTSSGHVRVLDFGLAQTMGSLADQATTVERLTEPGAVAGTIRYMSPEQVKGEVVDERSDVFSLGAVLYEMVGRGHPFGEVSPAETIAAILTREAQPLADAIPADVRRIVGKCLEKDRTRRYQTARDLAVDLESAGRTLASPAPAAAGPRKVSGMAVAAGLVVVIALGAIAAWQFRGGPAALPGASEFMPITDFADSAVAPAISPDGRMVTFMRGTEPFLGRGEIYVKLLPNGEAKQLTNDARPKYGPVFTPDGTRVAYTAVGDAGWETVTVPVLGGEPTRLLPNAAGLTWIGDRQVLFSEIKGTGLHMGLVTSTETRANRREIYFPAHERAMAHYSALSPDGKTILVVEMGRTGGWERCHVLPLEGAAAGREVGPPGECRAAAWSPDGRWIYLNVDDGAATHLWRQRFPDGAPEPITSSPATDELGLAVAPDGRSIITSVGRRTSALWWHEGTQERSLTSEGFASMPQISRDGRRVFYLLQRADSPETRLAMIDIGTSRTETLLPDVSVSQFDLSPDGRAVAYSTAGPGGRPQVWVTALDRASPPRRIAEGVDSIRYAADDTFIVRTIEGHANFIDRLKSDGTVSTRVRAEPVVQLGAMSPDGRWVLAHQGLVSATHGGTVMLAIPVDGGAPMPMCAGPCRVAWTTDGRYIFVMMLIGRRTLVAPVPPGRAFPDVPTAGADPIPVWAKLPGARWLTGSEFAPGADPSSYVFAKREELRNLFRIPIR